MGVGLISLLFFMISLPAFLITISIVIPIFILELIPVVIVFGLIYKYFITSSRYVKYNTASIYRNTCIAINAVTKRKQKQKQKQKNNNNILVIFICFDFSLLLYYGGTHYCVCVSWGMTYKQWFKNMSNFGFKPDVLKNKTKHKFMFWVKVCKSFECIICCYLIMKYLEIWKMYRQKWQINWKNPNKQNNKKPTNKQRQTKTKTNKWKHNLNTK